MILTLTSGLAEDMKAMLDFRPTNMQTADCAWTSFGHIENAPTIWTSIVGSDMLNPKC